MPMNSRMAKFVWLVADIATPPRLEHERKYERIDQQHQDRIEQGPGDTEERTAIAPDYFPAHELADELPVSQQTRNQRSW